MPRATARAARPARRERTGGSRRGRIVGALIVLAAAGLALAPLDATWIERVYARGWYPALQPWLTAASSLAPFALLDLWLALALGAVGLGVWRIARAAKGSRVRRLVTAAARGIVAAAAIYLVFLACWGLNYRRQPITASLDFDAARVTAAAVDAAAVRAVGELNRRYEGAHADLASTPTLAAVRVRLAPAFAAAQRALGQQRLATPGRPKTSLLSPFFRAATVDGMVNPLGLEVIVNPDVLPLERPFVLAHEWGHLAGWARESEASYVGWLTCLAGDGGAQYSGWLSLYWHLRRDVARDRLPAIERGLARGPREDLAAIAARLRRGQPLIRQASWQTYDQFLKANRVDAGVRSYDEVVTLVLGIATGPDGRPSRRYGQ